MQRELKRKWIKALLSGRYKQGTGSLQNRDGTNCCLGVLCRVARLRMDNDNNFYFKLKNGDEHREGGSLPLAFRELVNIRNSEESMLIQMNDESKASFKEIAAWIRTNL